MALFLCPKKFLELLHNIDIIPANTLIEKQITGGIITMKQHPNTKKQIRRSLINWKHSVKKVQSRCYVSNSDLDLEIHHAGKNFSDIFHEAHKNLNLEYHKDTKSYNEADLNALIDEVVRLHKDVVPVVLNHDIHLALHQKYGSHVSLDQIEAFKAAYINSKGEDTHGKEL